MNRYLARMIKYCHSSNLMEVHNSNHFDLAKKPVSNHNDRNWFFLMLITDKWKNE